MVEVCFRYSFFFWKFFDKPKCFNGVGIMGKISNVLCGVAGEYFVAAELTRRGHIASITLRNTKGIDILASNEDANRQVGIQVKTNQGNKPGWLLNKGAEDYFADLYMRRWRAELYFLFVILK